MKHIKKFKIFETEEIEFDRYGRSNPNETIRQDVMDFIDDISEVINYYYEEGYKARDFEIRLRMMIQEEGWSFRKGVNESIIGKAKEWWNKRKPEPHGEEEIEFDRYGRTNPNQPIRQDIKDFIDDMYTHKLIRFDEDYTARGFIRSLIKTIQDKGWTMSK